MVKQTGINISEKSSLIWNSAEILLGIYKPHEYGKVILPMTVIKRFHDCLLADSFNIEENFRAYLNGFSDNVQDILKNFEFEQEIKKLADNDKLFYIIQEFNTGKANMGPGKITSVDMGYILEDLIKKFSESYNEEAGAHFTSRDII